MVKCQIIKILFKLIPFKSIQYSLIQTHLLKCDDCLKNLAGTDEARKITVSKSRLEDVKDLWPQFLKDLEQQKQKKKVTPHLTWRWALGSAAALVLTLGLIIVITQSPKNEYPDESTVKLTIDYINLYEEPRQAIIFQTQDASKTFVWVEKLSKGDMP